MARPKAEKSAQEEPLERQLWKSADKLRKNIDAAEYKHVVLGLIFLKYISDSFEEVYAKLKAGEGEFAGADPEDKDEYAAENVFFVPAQARWSYLLSQAAQPTIGQFIDGAMDAIERENPLLKGVLPKVFSRQNLDPLSLGGLMKLVGSIALGDAKARSADVLGHVFEYFLGEFALAEGKQGGQFYTPRSIVELLVAMLEPYKGRVFDPCCGSGGMFVQSEKFVASHQGQVKDISIYGQESNEISPTSHGRPLAELEARNNQVDLLTREFLMDSTVVVAVFLIRAFEERQALSVVPPAANSGEDGPEAPSYEDNEAFNDYWDESFGEFTMGDYAYAFYTAVANNDSARELMQKDQLRELAVVLTQRVRENASIDWTIKENVRAKLKVMVKRTLRQYGYPPDMQLLATETVIRQAEMMADELTG